MVKQCSTCHFYFLQNGVGKCKQSPLPTNQKNTIFDVLAGNVIWIYASVHENHCCSSYQEKKK